MSKEEFSKKILSRVEEAPRLPGCYLFKNKSGEILYVGKAKRISSRIKSYVNNFHSLEKRIQNMIVDADEIEFITVDSEVEALILENNLIKKYHPKYNILMRDDKSYLWVRFERVRKINQQIPTRTSVYQDFPRITTTRNKKDDGAEYFGPFPDTMPVKRILRRLRKLFPFRSTKHLVYQISSDPLQIHTDNKKPCFYYHIGLCDGACAGLESKEHYVTKYNQIRKFFLGEKKDIVRNLEQELKKASKELRFEEAAEIRDKIEDIVYVTSKIRLDNDTDDVLIQGMKKKLQDAALNNLVSQLEFPAGTLEVKDEFKIECYDISNIQGTNAVGSMVVMVDGKLMPELYRRFRIRRENSPNDFAMLQEVLTRRFRNVIVENDVDDVSDEIKKKLKTLKPDPSFSKLPDLIIIDGGKGQLTSTYKILRSMGLHNIIPITGLAKREEILYKLTDQMKDEHNQVNDSPLFTEVKLPKNSESLYLIQKLRDEAHRFAITYHRNLRSKQMLKKNY
jgi:excinuclease ABC subunit C